MSAVSTLAGAKGRKCISVVLVFVCSFGWCFIDLLVILWVWISAFQSSQTKKKNIFSHQFPINILCCEMERAKHLLDPSSPVQGEAEAPNKLKSPENRVNSEPNSATSLACVHTSNCSITDPNITAWKGKITSLTGSGVIRSAMTKFTDRLTCVNLERNVCLTAEDNQVTLFQMVCGCTRYLFIVLWVKKRTDEIRWRERPKKRERGNQQSEREGSLSTTGTLDPAQLEGLWRGRSHLSYTDKWQMEAHYCTEC